MRQTTKSIVFSVMFIALLPFTAKAAATYDCDTFMGWTASYLRDNPDVLLKADVDKAIRACQRRGYDAPVAVRPREGKLRVKTGGSGGFYYGNIAAPESPPGARKANASVSRDVMNSSCNFPPRIRVSLTPPYVNFPPGSCYAFISNLLKDKYGGTTISPPPTGVLPTDTCPAETDTTGAFGVKTSIAAGDGFPLTCGGMVPTSTMDLYLNMNPTAAAITQEGSYFIRYFTLAGANFVNPNISGANPDGWVKLPSYLCTPISDGDGGTIMVKSVDLTGASAQIFTYDASVGSLYVRLKPRTSMPTNFIPPYNPADPEKFLVIPVDGSGNLSVPADCALESAHYMTAPTSRQDILLRPSVVTGCEGAKVADTPVNTPICPATATMDAMGVCRDTTTGAAVAAISNWEDKCPDGSVKPPAPAVCPQTAALSVCPDGSVAPPTGICPSTGLPPAGGACAASGAYPDASCDQVTVMPETAACYGQTQYGVMNRPNLYYPSGSTAPIYVLGGATPQALAGTVANSRLFAQPSTKLFLSTTVPPLTLNEGGMIRMLDGSTLVMNQEAIVNAATATITMANGGKLLSGGGTQIGPSFADGAVYTIPAARLKMPLEINLQRSVTLPAGYMIPTMPRVLTQPPYVRLPVAPPAP